MYRFVVKKNYIELLASLEKGEAGIKECSKRIGMNYYHLYNVIEQFHKEGIVKKEKDNNAYAVSLTDHGKKIVRCLIVLRALIDKNPVKDPLDEENRILKERIKELEKTTEGEPDANEHESSSV